MSPLHRKSLACALSAVLAVGRAHAAEAPGPSVEARLEQRLDQLQQELESVKAELRELKAQRAAGTAQPAATAPGSAALAAPAVVLAAPPPAAGAASGPLGGISPDLTLWGYGEVYYTHPVNDARDTQFDLARAVFGIGYRLDERTDFNSEYEVEHAVASATDKGEFEVEQFYIDRQLSDWVGVRAGLFLMPFGLLNEHHEPTAFYGVQRNFVETLVIPSTWREGGIGLHGSTPVGLRWDAGVTTDQDLSGWNPNPENPQYRTALELEDNDVAPLQATHQELQLANARHLAQYVSLNYDGVPGLNAGAAIFTGKAAVPTVPAGLPDQRVTLWETHLRWTPGAADLSAVYAHGQISNTATYNLNNAGASNPMPAQFLGYFVQGAYTVWQHGGYRFSPFVRWEHYDLGAQFQGIAPGFTSVPIGPAADGRPWPQPHDQLWTLGTSLFLNPHLVLKADYQHFDVNRDFTRFDLGLGLSF